MTATLWGVRGSQAAPGPETIRYGGNTACVQVTVTDDCLLMLDAGTGARRLGAVVPPHIRRIDILLTHLHMDHIQGLGFFEPLFEHGREVHIWGPPSTVLPLRARLSRYLSPPLFPVRLRDLPCTLLVHDVPPEPFEVPGALVTAASVCHPGPTVGYRIDDGAASLAYLPDHEPALGPRAFPREPRWTSGWDLIERADVLIHDAQYFADEYPAHVGWGHSTVEQAVALAELAGVRVLVPFHHDPVHTDDDLDKVYVTLPPTQVAIIPGREGMQITPTSGRIGPDAPRVPAGRHAVAVRAHV
jgi:phosphoribosyl 1,2-cyclic phosphodiesterase